MPQLTIATCLVKTFAQTLIATACRLCVQPIVIMSNISSLVSVLGFGASTSYLSALMTRMSGGLCNFTFG